MPSKKLLVGIAAATVFVIGAGYIVYAGRPVMKTDVPTAVQASTQAEDIDDEEEFEDADVLPTSPVVTEKPTTSTTPIVTKGTYTLADVQTHNAKSDCWSAIGGDVYDLTTWVSRHPGGEKQIIGLCGTDGTAAYTNQHGDKGRPKAMLVLLKIGTLK